MRLAPIGDAYFASHGLRKVFNYIAAYGLRDTWNRVRSRLAEKDRNEKYVAFGLGEVIEAEPPGPPCGSRVAFVAPFHPACVEEVTLDPELVQPLQGSVSWPLSPGVVLTGSRDLPGPGVGAIMGWAAESGYAFPDDAFKSIVSDCIPWVLTATTNGSLTALSGTPSPPPGSGASARPSEPHPSKPRAVVFGLGHYSRTTLIPRVSRFVDVACCHEIDPTQAGRIADAPWEIRSSPEVDADEVFDVAFAAGYHHTHARIAAEALRRDKAVVVEKPLATTREELDLVLAAAERSRGRVFVAYQRRYSAFNRFLKEDLHLGPGTPVSLSAIVYEVPLPRHHWYRWPASRGRIVCNGCHWIDYFLFLNEYRPLRTLDVRSAPNGDHVVQATLEDEATLSLVLTEVGSPRLNMRDIVRVAAGSRSAVIIDQCRYESEGPDRIIRRARTRRADSFSRMYNTIAASLAGGAAGDSLESLRVSATAVLDAQALVGDPHS